VRLTDREHRSILACARAAFGTLPRVTLFGSRTDDSLRGGDIDLLVEQVTLEKGTLARKLHFMANLQEQLGEQKIDIIVTDSHDQRPVVQRARLTGIRL
jgi:predicted nucleotidyltransferase